MPKTQLLPTDGNFPLSSDGSPFKASALPRLSLELVKSATGLCVEQGKITCSQPGLMGEMNETVEIHLNQYPRSVFNKLVSFRNFVD